ncbi:hypothetical protein OKW21_001674 [Catalinimonas alkaloidigena]|nr:hypothetical protein [Catalinimonas alkaloidigena]
MSNFYSQIFFLYSLIQHHYSVESSKQWIRKVLCQHTNNGQILEVCLTCSEMSSFYASPNDQKPVKLRFNEIQ